MLKPQHTSPKPEPQAVAERMRLEGRTAVITGAAGGIGRAIAVSLARRRCNLAVADVNQDGLAATAELARAYGVKTSQHVIDVANRTSVAEFPHLVTQEHSGVDLLVNNAGVAVGGTFEQVAEADFEWLFEINFWGVVRMTRAFLPLLRCSDEAHIVNISSLFGLIAPPGQSAYCASKFAVRGFSESLRRELEAEGARIAVTTVHPGGVNTSIAENARVPRGRNAAQLAEDRDRFQKFLVMPPERAGEIIVSGMERGRPRILVGRDAKGAALIERLAPVSYWKHLQRKLK
jgi:short-subunit dehydrogenase